MASVICNAYINKLHNLQLLSHLLRRAFSVHRDAMVPFLRRCRLS